ncbi:hypothetical protein [Sphingomonas zeae]
MNRTESGSTQKDKEPTCRALQALKRIGAAAVIEHGLVQAIKVTRHDRVEQRHLASIATIDGMLANPDG